MAKTVYGESEEMKRGYELYFSLGHNRSCELTSTMTGQALRTIQHWCKTFSWEDRIHKYIIEHGDFPSAVDNLDEPLIDFLKDNPCGLPRPSDATLSPEQLVAKYAAQNAEGAMTKAEYRVMLGKMIRDFTKRFYDGDVKINSMYELEKLIKLDLLLMGEPTSRGSVDVTGMAANNEYYINVEQTINNNPAAQELLKEVWRSLYSTDSPNQSISKDAPSVVSSLPLSDVFESNRDNGVRYPELKGRLLISNAEYFDVEEEVK